MPYAVLTESSGGAADLETCANLSPSGYPDPTRRFPAPVAGRLVDLVAQSFQVSGGGATIDLLVNGSSVMQLVFANNELATKSVNGVVVVAQGDKVSFRLRRPGAGGSWVHASSSFQLP